MWASGRPIREWPGVTVNRDGRVTGLALQGLGGKLPPELGNLDKLESLSLSGTLNEEIPSSLASLANLSSLSLSGSRLCGAIPAELGSLNKLTALDLSSNQLSGAIPPELGSLDKLTVLDLSSNRLSGEIPPELGSFAKLTALDLSSNQLTGEIPTELGNLSRLTYFWGQYSPVRPLTSLDFSNNRLSGEIPSGLDATWVRLDLSDNPLTGCISDYLSEQLMSRQRRLSLPSLPVCDAASDPRDEEALTAIYQAMGAPGWEKWLSREPISQWQGVSTDRDGRVVGLNLRGNQLTGEIPPELGNLVNLKYLDFQGNQLTGEIPPELGNLVNLTWLDLGSNQLTGEIPPEWEKLDGLAVNFRNTGLCKSSAQAALTGYANLCHEREAFLAVVTGLGLNLSYWISELVAADSLPAVFAFTDIAGVIYRSSDKRYGHGAETDENGHLVYLKASASTSTTSNGEIPPEIGNLVNLTTLELHGELTGEIPLELGNLVNLTTLDLGYNELTGCVPASLYGRAGDGGTGLPSC